MLLTSSSYCNRIYLAESTSNNQQESEDSAPTIYHTLLTLYLTPPAPYSSDKSLQVPLLGAALSLLSHHGARLPASQTLSLLPESLPLEKLYRYFEARLRAATTAANEERIVAKLRYVERTRVDDLVVREKGRRALIGEERVCSVCGKRFGGAAIRVMPRRAGAPSDGGEVVHYGCFGKGEPRRASLWA